MTHVVEWIDSRREPQCPANPAYPEGVDVDLTNGRGWGCVAPLAYPAARCGFYVVRCTNCKLVVGVTTAGRADDPRSVRLPCKLRRA